MVYNGYYKVMPINLSMLAKTPKKHAEPEKTTPPRLRTRQRAATAWHPAVATNSGQGGRRKTHTSETMTKDDKNIPICSMYHIYLPNWVILFGQMLGFIFHT